MSVGFLLKRDLATRSLIDGSTMPLMNTVSNLPTVVAEETRIASNLLSCAHASVHVSSSSGQFKNLLRFTSKTSVKGHKGI